MKAVRTSEKTVYFHETTQRYTPESCHLLDNKLDLLLQTSLQIIQ
jgi:hypothetical protein